MSCKLSMNSWFWQFVYKVGNTSALLIQWTHRGYSLRWNDCVLGIPLRAFLLFGCGLCHFESWTVWAFFLLLSQGFKHFWVGLRACYFEFWTVWASLYRYARAWTISELGCGIVILEILECVGVVLRMDVWVIENLLPQMIACFWKIHFSPSANDKNRY